ncbi:hypothetical protein B0H66DRAFT_68374 [Apodospora peruviana]|uniref:DUF8035 domain-containing protein n=1 Tax=Apodospora peruviana TaxID=516989 RepID=A0AAE0ISQ3_9PEZI|nr:hypothetical protein B0H66DRAFT_68374 [Apodospora peruviana]
MASRNRVEFEEREYYREPPRRQSRPPPTREYEEDVDIHIHNDRVPAFMREERRSEPGTLVLRQRDVETVERERPRRRSPSPALRVRERVIQRARSVSPAPPRRVEEDVRIRTVEKVREPSRGPPAERIHTRIVERGRSPSPQVRERIRIVEKERERSPSPPPRQVVKGPVIEREVITHYRDIDHGLIVARPPSPPPPPRRRAQETDIDIYTSRSETEVDIHKHSSHSRGRERSRSRDRPSRPSRPSRAWDDEVLVHADTGHLHVDVERRRSTSRGRRAHSAAPPIIDYSDDEGRSITRKIDSRGRMGEAWGGATKDWTIVDVPPGTERVRMDGVGGGQAEVTWQKYSGVRRSKFIPERTDERSMVVSSSSSDRDVRERDRDTRLSVQIYKDSDREREVDYEKVTDRRLSIRASAPPSPRRSDMWTEITKDLVTREAIEQLGYEYEETEWFYYIMQYLRYDDVLQLVQLSEDIRRARKERAREIQWEREWREEWDRDRYHNHHHHHHSKHRHSVDRYEDERITETEVVYDTRPSRTYRY